MASTTGKTFFNENLTSGKHISASDTIEARDVNFVGILLTENVNPCAKIAAKIQHSPDNKTWFDLCIFEEVVGQTCSQIIHVNESDTHVLSYVRAHVQIIGLNCDADINIKLFHGRN